MAVPRPCPRCGCRQLYPVAREGSENLLCLECRRCWQPEDGHFLQVNPYACAGCPDRRFCLFLVDTAPVALQCAMQAGQREA
jgi:hypothetical protein